MRSIEELLSLLSVSLFNRSVAVLGLARHYRLSYISFGGGKVALLHKLLFIGHAQADTSVHVSVVRLELVNGVPLFACEARTSSRDVLTFMFLHTLKVTSDSSPLH